MRNQSRKRWVSGWHGRLVRIMLFGVLLNLLPADVLRAQTYEVLQPGLFRVGNSWEFDSLLMPSNVAFTMSWQMVKTERIGGRDTVLLRENATPYFVDDMSVFLDQNAMTIVQVVETRYNPLQHISGSYSDPLEKIPRFVSVGDSGRTFGHGQSASYVVEDPTQQWTRIQDQTATLMRTESVAVAAGIFPCVVIRVNETWQYNNGWTGVAVRDFWLNHTVGPVAMDYQVWDTDPYGRVYYSAVSHRLRRFIPAVPDLIIDQGAFSPNPVEWGQTLKVQWREACLYQNASATHGTSVYLSTDTVITSHDALLVDGQRIPAFLAGQVYATSATAVITPQISGGDYYVAVVVDSRNEVAELDEANSFPLTAKLKVTTKPELAVTTGSFSPSTLGPGDILSVRGVITNIGGTAAPPTWTHVYLSTDSVIETTDYPLITGIQTPRLDPWASYTFERSVSRPSGLAEGIYYVGIFADVSNAVSEINEQNNTLTLPGLLFVARADLEATSGSFAPSPLAPGDVLTLKGTITNVGGATAPPTWAHVYLSTDTLIGATDYPLITGIQIPSLAHSAHSAFSQSAFVPLGFAEGTYYVGIVADVGNAVNEMNERNNLLVLPNVLVIGRPDLQMTGGWFAPTTVAPGQQITLQATIKNTGPLPAGANWVRICLSPDNAITSGDAALQSDLRCPALAPASVITINADPTIPPTISLGIYYLGLICDVRNEVVEGNEINNAKAFPGTLVIAQPDLVADRLDFAPNVVKNGDAIRVAGFVRNSGGAAISGGFWIEFFVSPNADFSSPRHLLCNSIHVSTLAGNGTYSLVALERTVSTSAPPGAYTFGIVIDRLNEVSESNEANNTLWVSGRRIYIGVRPTRADHWHLYR